MAYGQALKDRVLALYDEGKTTQEIAQQFRVCKSWCRRVKQRRHQAPLKIGGGTPRLSTEDRAALTQWIQEKPDSTLEELRQRLSLQRDVNVSMGCLWNTLRAMKFSFKKSRSTPASK